MMIYSISQPYPRQFDYGGKTVRFNLAFDRVLQFYSLFSDSSSPLSDCDKLDAVYDWFVSSPRRASREFRLEVVDAIFDRYISLHRRSVKTDKADVKLYDYDYDSGFIYSSFMQTYGINLFSAQGKLQWWEFVSLFEGLPADSKIKEIIEIRAREFPQYDGKNIKQIQQLAELKMLYALPKSQTERENDTEDGWNRLFETMKNKAGGGK